MPTTLDLMEYANDAAAQAAYVSSDDKFALQLREHKFFAAYDPTITFTKTNTHIRCISGTAYLGCGYVFVSLPKSYLDGRKLKLTWQTSSSKSDFPFYARIYDGAYDRTSGTDFPTGSAFPLKGAGLLQTIEDLTGTNASHTVTITMNLSSAQLDTVTIMTWLKDSWNEYPGDYFITGLQITDLSNNVLWSADLSGSLVMEQTGTTGDYGIIGAGSINLTCFSESSIKEQGSYSLKGVAKATNSLNDALTRTVNPTVDLTGKDRVKFKIRASRTGSNIKVGIRDSGTTTIEHTPNILVANTWQTEKWYVGNLAKLNKDAIDRIIFTIVNADSDNIFYIDDMQAYALARGPVLV